MFFFNCKLLWQFHVKGIYNPSVFVCIFMYLDRNIIPIYFCIKCNFESSFSDVNVWVWSILIWIWSHGLNF